MILPLLESQDQFLVEISIELDQFWTNLELILVEIEILTNENRRTANLSVRQFDRICSI